MRRYVMIALFLVLISAGVTYSILIWEVPAPESGNSALEGRPNLMESKGEEELGGWEEVEEDSGLGKEEFHMESNLITQAPVDPEEIKMNTNRPKITTQLILERYYTFCQHKEVEEMNQTSPLITLPRQELLELYPGWVVKEDFGGRLVLHRQINDLCPKDLEKRYVGEKSGFVTIFYGQPGQAKQKVFRTTDIPVEGFPLQIKAQLEKGILSESESHLISILDGLEVYYGE